MFQLQFAYVAKECSEKDTSSCRKQHRGERIPKHRGCPNFYEDDPDEGENEEYVMVAKCHSDETYSFIQGNREGHDYYKQLSQ